VIFIATVKVASLISARIIGMGSIIGVTFYITFSML